MAKRASKVTKDFSEELQELLKETNNPPVKYPGRVYNIANTTNAVWGVFSGYTGEVPAK